MSRAPTRCTRSCGPGAWAERRLTLPLGFLGMIVLLIAGESFSLHRGREVMTTGAANYLLAGESACREAARSELLCLGDSLVKFGFVPRVFEETTGLRAFNLGIIGGQPPASYSVFRKALASGARPQAVVVDFKPSILVVNSQFNTRSLTELLDLAECVELGRVSRDAEFLAQLVVGRLCPTYRRRLDLRDDIRAALGGRRLAVQDELLPLWRNWRVNQGALLLNQVPGLPPPSLGAADHPVYLPDSWNIDRVNAKYVRRFFKLAEENHIPVFWVMPPIRPDVQRLRDVRGLDADYDAFARRIQDQFRDVTIIDARHAGYREDLFVDLAHLEGRGAAQFSAAVGAVLAERLDLHTDRPASSTRTNGGAWVSLPPFRDRPIRSSFEDIAGSRMALGLESSEGTRRR